MNFIDISSVGKNRVNRGIHPPPDGIRSPMWFLKQVTRFRAGKRGLLPAAAREVLQAGLPKLRLLALWFRDDKSATA